MSEHTYTQAVADLFRARPGEWIDGLELARAGGAYAWRSRVSNARRDFGMTIENKVERDERGVASSYYRYRPEAKTYADLLQIAEAS